MSKYTSNQMESAHPLDTLKILAQKSGNALDKIEFARFMDLADELRKVREEFLIPLAKNVVPADSELCESTDKCIYLCGNSLGVQSIHTRRLMNDELDVWQER